jgi:hypothetical protein
MGPGNRETTGTGQDGETNELGLDALAAQRRRRHPFRRPLAGGCRHQRPAARVYDQDKAAFVAWLAENGQSFRLWHFMAGLAFLLFYFPFFAGFCERLQEAEGTPATWSRVTWAGAIISPAAGTTSGASIMGVALLR